MFPYSSHNLLIRLLGAISLIVDEVAMGAEGHVEIHVVISFLLAVVGIEC